jgi:hypothetical protein
MKAIVYIEMFSLFGLRALFFLVAPDVASNPMLSRPAVSRETTIRESNLISKDIFNTKHISSPSENFDMLKEKGGTGSTIDPETHRQHLAAFANNFTSSRYEVSFYSLPSSC